MGILNSIKQGALDAFRMQAEASQGQPKQVAETIRDYVLPQDAVDVGLMTMMGPGARTARRLGGAALAGSGYSPEAEASLLNQLRRVIMGQQDAPDLLRALNHIRQQKPSINDTNAWNRVTLPDEMASNMQHPDVRTHVFFDKDNVAKGAYQLDGRNQIPYLLSDHPGLGSELLEDAYFMAPKKPLSLHAIPGSEGFYRKQPGWVESQEDGISKFLKKARGGLVQMKECNCGR